MLATALLILAVQDPPPQETVVVAPRAERASTATTAQVTVVTGEELQDTGERSLPRALAKAGGVWVQETNLGGGAPILRGLVGNQVLIVVDGVRMNDSTTRTGPNQSLNEIDPATIDRIEILRGPASVLYGSDAIGGAILIWTKRRAPASRAPEGPTGTHDTNGGAGLRSFVETQLGSAYGGGRLSFGLSGATQNNGWIAIGSGESYDDLRAGGGETIDATGYHGGGLFGSWESAIGLDRTLRAVASAKRNYDVPRTDRLIPGFGQTVPANDEFDYALQARDRFLIAYDDRRGGLADAMQVRLSYRHTEEERKIRGFGASVRRIENDQVDTFGLGADWRKSLGNHLLTWGLDLDHDRVDSVRDDLDLSTGVSTPRAGAFAPDSRYTAAGIFVQDELFSFDPLLLTAGLRYSYFDFAFEDVASGGTTDGDFDALTASLQASYDLSDGVRLGATLAQGFRAPNLSELAKNNTFSGGDQLANPDLQPEESLMGELALELVEGAWLGSLAVYHNRIEDAVGRVLLDPGGPEPGDELWLRDNVGRLDITGVEAAAKRQLGGVDSPYAASARAEYTYGRTGDGDPARRIPPLFGALGLEWLSRTAKPRFHWARLEWIWALAQDDLNPEDVADPRIDPTGTAGWNRVDLDFGGAIGKRGSGSSWSLGLHNLFDERYRVHGSGHDAAGINLVLGISASM